MFDVNFILNLHFYFEIRLGQGMVLVKLEPHFLFYSVVNRCSECKCVGKIILFTNMRFQFKSICLKIVSEQR